MQLHPSPELRTIAMQASGTAHDPHHDLVCWFSGGGSLRSRSVGPVVLAGVVDVPPPPSQLLSQWQREASVELELEPGDVEPLSLPRARRHWPDYKLCVQAVSAWACTLGLPGVLDAGEVALMACRGARYHHDAVQYGDAAFCNLFLGEDAGLDVHFPLTGQRIPLVRGTVLLFDTGQPHAVILRGSSGFDAADFPHGPDWTQFFLTWELPLEASPVAAALGIAFDVDPVDCADSAEPQIRLNGEAVGLCPASGGWQRTA